MRITTTLDEPLDVDDRLAQLGLEQPILREVVLHGYGYAIYFTDNDPPSSKGSIVWGKSTRKLRDLLKDQGWIADNTGNYASTVHPTGDWAVVVSAGDWRTGLVDHTPSTRSPKGPKTKAAVDINQLQLFPVEDYEADPDRVTWLLLHYWNLETREIRAELSLPFGMDQNHVSRWKERLILSWPTRGAGEQDIVPVAPRQGRQEHGLTDSLEVPVAARSA